MEWTETIKKIIKTEAITTSTRTKTPKTIPEILHLRLYPMTAPAIYMLLVNKQGKTVVSHS